MKSDSFDMTSLEAAFAAAAERKRALSCMGRWKRLWRSPRQASLSLIVATLRNGGTTFRIRTKTFWGAPMTIVLPEVISGEVARFGFVEENLVSALMAHLRPNATFFDVGAHFGFFSLLAADLVGWGRGAVHAFEPVPSTYRILQRNVEPCGVTALNAALWCEPTEIEITDWGLAMSAFNSVRSPRLQDNTGPKREAAKIKVPAITLDGYAETHGLTPDFVKIDAESAEYEVLQGMKRILTEKRPVVSLEVGDFGVAGARSSRELVEHVCDHGYNALEYSDGTFLLHQLRDRYAYSNIIFVPR